MTAAAPDLERIDEDFSRLLAIVAHPDDLEYGAAAALARWSAQGKHITYALATSGEAGIDGIEPVECATLREAEQRESARIVGVEDLEFWGFADGVLEYGLELRAAVARAVRAHRPEVVVTINFHAEFGPGAYNQADHIALGRAVLDGVRDAGNRWVFRDQVAAGLEPHKAATILVAGSPKATGAVDVTEHFTAGVASLEAHAEYLRGLGADHPMADAAAFLEGIATATGQRAGVDKAVAFEVISV